jgi:two-component system response regulator HydG
VTVNCAAIPESLLESELFGYEKGAFTGAVARKEGRFDLAHGGTLFLDEVTEMKPAVQVRLLRVLQDGEYERVGGTETLHADVRVIAATNRDIRTQIEKGDFREDLYYRLNVIPLSVPPLRDRYEDIALLAQHFLVRYAQKNQKDLKGFTPEALEALNGWRWAGNVRELENAVERAVVLCRGDRIDVLDLPPGLREGQGRRKRLAFEVGTPLKNIERRMIEETLRFCDGDKSLAASLMGITARTIYRREAEWAQEREEEEADEAREA